jgi:hypothetical protein
MRPPVILTASIPASLSTASNDAVNLTGPIADAEPEPRDAFAEVHQEVAGLLGVHGPSGMGRNAQHVQVAVADFEREQDV